MYRQVYQGASLDMSTTTLKLRPPEDFLHSLEGVTKGEVIRMVAGEACYLFFHKISRAIERLVREKECEIKIIAGPIIWVQEETRNNGIFNLTEDKHVTLYKANRYQTQHCTIFGDRMVWVEPRRYPLPEKRIGYYIENNPLLVGKYIYDFDTAIEIKNFSASSNPRNDFILMNRDEIQNLLSFADRQHLHFEFLTLADIIHLTKQMTSTSS